MTPSNRSGALPTTTASMSDQPTCASAMARSTASRSRPGMDTSVRLLRWWVCPVPSTAARCLAMPSAPLQDGDQVLLQCGPARGVAEGAAGVAVEDALGGLADAGQSGREHRVARQR